MSEPTSELLIGLLLFIQTELGLFNDISPPHIVFMAEDEIAEFVCEQPCANYNSIKGIKGWVPPPGDNVYLSQDLNFTHNMFDRSIVLHELVHYVQYKYQLSVKQTDCLTWKTREAQAYELQSLWLKHNKVQHNNLRFIMAMRNFHRLQCPPEDKRQASASNF